MSRENRLWGTERIRGELLKLGIVVSNRLIRRYRRHGPRCPSSQLWRRSWPTTPTTCGPPTCSRCPPLTFKTLHVLIFIAQARRELVHGARPMLLACLAGHEGGQAVEQHQA